MSYKAIYRKWRPQLFEDVIGQDHIIETLKNQIKNKNIAHAYLFCGTRGTGKTSTAKIFARAVNCLKLENLNPCNHCEVCEGILTEGIMDVIEIDAASNNGVDHIREIRENVKYPPSKGRYKVYIIDEVHMLSSGAFNALLKTLEEPPDHVIFILATTDPQKLPATILSRCQRFDFKPVKVQAIMERLRTICEAMEIEWEEEALRLIALSAQGALRDGLSILEQCISFSRGKLTYGGIIDILGIVSYDSILKLGEALQSKDVAKALMHLQQMVAEGKDIQQLIKDLIYHFRGLLMAKMKVKLEEQMNMPQETLERIQAQSQQFEENQIIRAIHILSDTESKAKYATQPRILLEVALVTLCKSEIDASIEGLIERVKKIENSIRLGEIAFTKSKNSFLKKTIEQKAGLDGSNNNNIKEVDGTKDLQIVDGLEKREAVAEEEVNSQATLDFYEIQRRWQDILAFMRKDKKAQVQAMLMEGNLVELKGDRLIIGFKDGFGFHREALDKDKTKNYISQVIHHITGQSVKVVLVMDKEGYGKENQTIEKDPVVELGKILPPGLLEIIDE